MIDVHLAFFINMKQFDILDSLNLFYFQNLIQLFKLQYFNNLCKSKFDSLCVDHNVQLPKEELQACNNDNL
jgi:hypothetical protein